MAYVERRKSDFRARWKRPDGTYDSKPGFLTEDEALEYGRDQETDVRRGTYYDKRDGNIVLRQWASEWFEAQDLRGNSTRSYMRRWKPQIAPVWGELTLAHIAESPLKVKAWEKKLRASVSAATGRQLSKGYADSVVALFRLLLDDAVVEGLIAASPFPPQKSRRRGRYERPVTEEKVHATVEQVIALAENARTVWGLSGYVFILTKAFTGMRLGEMFGLRREYCYPLWPACDPDPDRAKRKKRIARYGDMPAIRVQWQYLYEKASDDDPGVPTLLPPKDDSMRTLVVPWFLAELLCDLLDSHDSEWVFPSLEGSSLLTTGFRTVYWYPIVSGAPARTGRYRRREIPALEELEGLVPHGLRHTQKVWLDEDDIPRVAAEERMGHLLEGVEGVYSHVTKGMEQRIMRALQERWELAKAAD